MLSNRERPIFVEPLGSGLRGITLRYGHQIRSAAEIFADIPNMMLPEKMLIGTVSTVRSAFCASGQVGLIRLLDRSRHAC